MVYAKFIPGVGREDTATESNGDVWQVFSYNASASTPKYCMCAVTRENFEGHVEDYLTFAYQEDKENILRFIHISGYQNAYSWNPGLATFLTSTEAKDQYPNEYEKIIAAKSEHNNWNKSYSFYD